MRDINRIPIMTDKFKKIWEKHPDLRFCQLIFVINEIYNDGKDIFFLEDDELEKAFEEILVKGRL